MHLRIVDLSKRERILLYGAQAWHFGIGMLGPLFAFFVQSLSGGILDVSYAWGAYLFLGGLLIPFVKYLSGFVDHEKLLVLGYALSAVLTFGYLFVDSPGEVILLQAGFGMGMALAIPTWTVLYSRHIGQGAEPPLLSLNAPLVSGVAVVLGGFIVSYWSFKALFIIMGTVQILTTFYVTRILAD